MRGALIVDTTVLQSGSRATLYTFKAGLLNSEISKRQQCCALRLTFRCPADTSATSRQYIAGHAETVLIVLSLDLQLPAQLRFDVDTRFAMHNNRRRRVRLIVTCATRAASQQVT